MQHYSLWVCQTDSERSTCFPSTPIGRLQSFPWSRLDGNPRFAKDLASVIILTQTVVFPYRVVSVPKPDLNGIVGVFCSGCVTYLD